MFLSIYLRNHCNNFSVDGGHIIPRKNERCTTICDGYTVHYLGGGITPSNEKLLLLIISYHLILNAINMPLNEFDVNVANGVAIDVANDVLPWWMEVYPFRFNQSKSVT